VDRGKPGSRIHAISDRGGLPLYQFGAAVTGRVGCASIAEWQRAKQAGDAAALRTAGDALQSSRQWKVLQQMTDEGDWPEVFWAIADKVAAGQPPTEYKQGIGCT
jgi:hypothetical protein